MNLICRIFGHNFKSINAFLTRRHFDGQQYSDKYQYLIACGRCGETIPIQESKDIHIEGDNE